MRNIDNSDLKSSVDRRSFLGITKELNRRYPVFRFKGNVCWTAYSLFRASKRRRNPEIRILLISA